MVVVVKTSPNLSQTDPGVEVSPCISSLNIPGKFAQVTNTCFTRSQRTIYIFVAGATLVRISPAYFLKWSAGVW